MNNNDSQTYLDSYIICCIISFLNQGEIFILYETSNYFKNFIDTHNFLKKCPPSQQIITRLKMLNWAETHSSFRYTKNMLESAVKQNKINIDIDKAVDKIKQKIRENNPPEWKFQTAEEYFLDRKDISIDDRIGFRSINKVFKYV